MENDKNKKNKLTTIVLSILLLSSVVGNVLLFTSKASTIEEKDNHISQLHEINTELENVRTTISAENERLSGKNAEMDSVLTDREKLIAENKAEIAKLIATVTDKDELIRKIRAAKSVLLQRLKQKEDQIEDLLAKNETLTKEKAELEVSLEELNEEKEKLQGKVDIASALKSEYLEITTMKKRKSGKFKSTKLSRRAQKVTACFDILENKVTTQGEKTVYLRIIAPNGEIIGNATQNIGQFELPGTGEQLKYSTKKEFTYSGEQQHMCLDYEEPEKGAFPEGEYHIEVYIDKVFSSEGVFTLK